MSSGGAPPPVAPTTSNPGLSALARGALPGGAAGALDVVLSQRYNPLAVLPAAMEVRLEEKDKPDPDFMTKYRTFLKEEYNVDLDLTLGCAFPASPPVCEGPGGPPVHMVPPTLTTTTSARAECCREDADSGRTEVRPGQTVSRSDQSQWA